MLQIEPYNTENIKEHIDNFERELNITLPEDYKQFLTKYNGGWTPDTVINFNNFDYEINGFNGVGNAKGAANFSHYKDNSVNEIRNEFYEDLRNGYLNIGDWYGAFYYLAIKPELENYGAIYFMDEDREGYIYVCGSFKELSQKAMTPDFHINTPEENIQYYKERGWEDKLTRSLIKSWNKAYNERKDIKLVPVIID